MYRFSGLVTLLIGAALVYMLAFTTFDRAVERWEYQPDGSLEQVEVVCPSPWSTLFEEADLSGFYPSEARLCVGSSKLLIGEAFIVATVSLGLAIWGISRGPKPPRKPIEVLPSVAAARARQP